jgi:hypothetical protein
MVGYGEHGEWCGVMSNGWLSGVDYGPRVGVC